MDSSIALVATLLLTSAVVVIIVITYYSRAYLYSCLLGTRNKYLTSKSKV